MGIFYLRSAEDNNTVRMGYPNDDVLELAQLSTYASQVRAWTGTAEAWWSHSDLNAGGRDANSKKTNR